MVKPTKTYLVIYLAFKLENDFHLNRSYFPKHNHCLQDMYF